MRTWEPDTFDVAELGVLNWLTAKPTALWHICVPPWNWKPAVMVPKSSPPERRAPWLPLPSHHSREVKARSGKAAVCWRPYEMWLRIETLCLSTALLEAISQPEGACSHLLTDSPPAVEQEKPGFAHFLDSFFVLGWRVAGFALFFAIRAVDLCFGADGQRQQSTDISCYELGEKAGLCLSHHALGSQTAPQASLVCSWSHTQPAWLAQVCLTQLYGENQPFRV